MKLEKDLEKVYQEYSIHSNLRKASTLYLANFFIISPEEVKSIREKYKTNNTESINSTIKTKKTEDGNFSKIEEQIEHTISKDKEGLKVELSGNDLVDNPTELLKLVNLNPDNFEVITFWRGFKKGKWWASIYVRPKTEVLSESNLLELFKEICQTYLPKAFEKTKEKKITEDGKKLAVVCLFDVHLGKDSMPDYTSQTSITEMGVFREFAKIYKVLQTQKVNEIHFIVGNDFFNVNDQRLTTVKGTLQDNTNNLYMVYKEGLHLMMSCIDYLSEITKVKVILVPGNHAEYTETLLATSLNAIYYKSKNVEVFDAPTDRKYFKFGKTLIGYSHGVKDPSIYAKLLPFEAKEHFSSCDNFYVLLGDKHHEHTTRISPVVEVDGVTVMQLGALSKTDRWHTKEGYISRRQSYLMIFDEEKGLEFQYSNLAG